MNAAQSCVAAVWKRLQSSDRPAAPGDFHHLASTCGADLWVLANVLRQTSKASAMKRSFFVKLNLDEVGHAIIEYDDMASLGQWFKGYLLGAHGRPAKADAPDPYQAGHAYGLAAFHDAEAFRAKQAANGALGGRPPKPEETQTLPKAKPDESQTITQTKPIEHRASSIEKREEITEHPRAGADPGDIFAGPGPDTPIDPNSRWPYVRALPWALDLVTARCKIGPGNWQAWDALVKANTLGVVLTAAKQVKPQERWPDHTEAMIAKLGSQESIGIAVSRKTIRIVNDD